VHNKTLLIMLKCNEHLCAFNKYRKCQTLLVITFFYFFAPSYFLITNMHVATEEFFSVMHSSCCLTGLGLIHLVLSLIDTQI